MYNINLKFKLDNYKDFVSKLKDIASIDPVVKIKIENDYIVMYSMLMDGTIITSMKSFILKTEDYLTLDSTKNAKDNYLEKDFLLDLEFVIVDGVKLVKQMDFIDDEKDINISLTYSIVDGIRHVRTGIINGKSNNKTFKINIVGGELRIIKSLNKSFLDSRLDPINSEWQFELEGSNISDIKKLASINSTNEKAIQVNIENGEVKFTEMGQWDLCVSNIDDNNLNTSILFAKKYLGHINTKIENVVFSKFPTFILVTMNDSKLIMSFEENFE